MEVECVRTITMEVVDFVGGDYTYERYSSNDWCVRIGESTETVFDCKELEDAYQAHVGVRPK